MYADLGTCVKDSFRVIGHVLDTYTRPCVMGVMMSRMSDVLGEDQTTTGWTVDDSTFAARLALVRHRMGWNVKEAAREVGVPAASWRSWEEGANPHRKVEIAEQIAERVGCDYGWLLVGRQRVIYAAPRSRTNPGSGATTRRARRSSKRRIDKRHVPQHHPIGRTETETTAPTQAGSPSQRRPGLITHRAHD